MIFLICVIWSMTKWIHFVDRSSSHMFLGLAHNLSFSLCLCLLMWIKTVSLNYSVKQVLLSQGPSNTFFKVAITYHLFLLHTSVLKSIDLYFVMQFLCLSHVNAILIHRYKTFIDLILQFMTLLSKSEVISFLILQHKLLQEETMNFLFLHYLTHSAHYQRESNKSYSQNCHPARMYASMLREGFSTSLLPSWGYHYHQVHFHRYIKCLRDFTLFAL